MQNCLPFCRLIRLISTSSTGNEAGRKNLTDTLSLLVLDNRPHQPLPSMYKILDIEPTPVILGQSVKLRIPIVFILEVMPMTSSLLDRCEHAIKRVQRLLFLFPQRIVI